MAEDTLGVKAAREWYAAAKPTYTTLVDPTHLVTELYNLVNVPSGIWVDEQGRVARINEGTYSGIIKLGAGTIGTDEYLPLVRDWVANGAKSRFAWAPERHGQADPPCHPATRLWPTRRSSSASTSTSRTRPWRATYWERAQALAPDNWNFHRQDWNLTEGLAGPKYREKRGALGDKPYHAPLETPPSRAPR